MYIWFESYVFVNNVQIDMGYLDTTENEQKLENPVIPSFRWHLLKSHT